MGLLSRIQSFARSALGIRAAEPPRTVDASEALRGRWGRWDSKVTDRMNQAHWSKVTGLPINAELAYASNWLRAQAEYEISSNPVMEGMVNTYITDVVGPEGPDLPRHSPAIRSTTSKRERIWRKWWRQAGANRQLSGVEILHGWVRSLWKAGEFGTPDDQRPQGAEGPVKLRLLPVHLHRLLTPPEILGRSGSRPGRPPRRKPQPDQLLHFRALHLRSLRSLYGRILRGPLRGLRPRLRARRRRTRSAACPGWPPRLDVVAQLRDWDKAMLDAAECSPRPASSGK